MLERLKFVYQETVRLNKMTNSNNEKALSENHATKSTFNSYLPEMEGNYSLFFNNNYPSRNRKFLKKILKAIAWPILKRQVFFNSAVKQFLYDLMQRMHDQSLKDQDISDKILQLESKLQETYTSLQQREISNKKMLLSHEESLKLSGLWFNDPVWVGYQDDGKSYWLGTTERIVEKSFVLQTLSHFYESNDIKILDIGACESLLSYELASLNYSVTAIDIRPISLSHPNLKFVVSDICEPVFPKQSFDCIIALSTLEHIGLGWYGDKQIENHDFQAVKQINLLLKNDGLFILTVPYGKKALTPVHRIYDCDSLQELLKDFKIIKSVYGIRLDNFNWTVTQVESEAACKQHNVENYLPGAVAMLVCKKKDLENLESI